MELEKQRPAFKHIDQVWALKGAELEAAFATEEA